MTRDGEAEVTRALSICDDAAELVVTGTSSTRHRAEIRQRVRYAHEQPRLRRAAGALRRRGRNRRLSADERVGTVSRAQLAGHLALTGGALHSARVTEIARTFPDDGIVDGAQQLIGGLPRGRYTWIVDDASGRDKLDRGRPESSVSIGVLRDGLPFVGAVYDGVTRWLFTACVGRGAWLNDRPLYAGRGLRSPRALIAVDAPGDDSPWRWRGMRVDGCHRVGSIALRLCYVALGGVDAVHDPGVSLTDIAGAAPIVTEAGGVLTSDTGAPLFPGWPAPALSARVAILAGNPAIHGQALRDVLGAH
jgi:myo-inositol-1(or 4)-monophosphatase